MHKKTTVICCVVSKPLCLLSPVCIVRQITVWFVAGRGGGPRRLGLLRRAGPMPHRVGLGTCGDADQTQAREQSDAHSLVGRLVGWLAGWLCCCATQAYNLALVGWLVGWLAGWPCCCATQACKVAFAALLAGWRMRTARVRLGRGVQQIVSGSRSDFIFSSARTLHGVSVQLSRRNHERHPHPGLIRRLFHGPMSTRSMDVGWYLNGSAANRSPPGHNNIHAVCVRVNAPFLHRALGYR